MKPVYALFDCNNCYVSCERVFQPYLRGIPIVCLSNNDGCIVARSNEAKAMGIKMGEPYFKIAAQCDRLGIAVLSSNYSLYADMSQRVMSVISECAPASEVYSIDEIFALLTGMPGNLGEYCRQVKDKVLQWTGIPVSVGIAGTKTLAKLANRLAKKSARAGGVIDLAGHPEWIDSALKRVEVGDVWGVGRRYAVRLIELGVRTAADLAEKDDKWVRREFGVVLARTAAELRGTVCHDLETQPQPRQSCCCSRSFGDATGNIEHVAEAIREFSQTAAERVRNEGLVAGHIQVFASTNRFRQDVVHGTMSASAPLAPATADGARISKVALALVRGCRTFEKGCEWTKAGVLLTDLCGKGAVKRDLFTVADSRRSDALMSAVDAVNSRFGRHCVGLGLSAPEAGWRMRRERLSPGWTTRWDELPVVR
ncbi:Y-family DNA polymerase [Propionivibrio sp.]|uniref:Y-family DNA polymerase n=1 Tax=Propionivibrio sp. TaxID=2212460 RepID=UPI003BF0FA59